MEDEQDLMCRFREAISKDDELNEQIASLQEQRSYWIGVRVEVRKKLAAMGIDPYEVVLQEELTTPTPNEE